MLHRKDVRASVRALDAAGLPISPEMFDFIEAMEWPTFNFNPGPRLTNATRLDVAAADARLRALGLPTRLSPTGFMP